MKGDEKLSDLDVMKIEVIKKKIKVLIKNDRKA
jgi:hypothetical protein